MASTLTKRVRGARRNGLLRVKGEDIQIRIGTQPVKGSARFPFRRRSSFPLRSVSRPGRNAVCRSGSHCTGSPALSARSEGAAGPAVQRSVQIARSVRNCQPSVTMRKWAVSRFRSDSCLVGWLFVTQRSDVHIERRDSNKHFKMLEQVAVFM